MPGRSGPATTNDGGRELLGLGALVVLLGVAFATLLVEPTQASVPPGVERIASAEVLELPDDRAARPADDGGPAPAPPDGALEAAPAPLVLDGMRLRVARLGIDLPVLAGDTERDSVAQATPAGAAFLLPSSAVPGSGGNAYVYAHARPGMFLSLWDVRLGDVVEVAAPSGEVRRYVVTEIHPRVVPTDVRYTLPTGDERITLQTSTGPSSGDPRFVVVAVRGR